MEGGARRRADFDARRSHRPGYPSLPIGPDARASGPRVRGQSDPPRDGTTSLAQPAARPRAGPVPSGRGRLPEPDLEPDPVGLERAGAKAALGGETFELDGGVGTISEPAQDPPRDEAVQAAELLAPHLLADV